MNGVKNFFKGIGGWFTDFVESIVHGDVFVKLSLFIMGIGCIRRKQIVKGIFQLILEVLFIFYMIGFGAPYISKIGTLGTVQREVVFNVQTMKNEVNQYDHSFKILLFSIISFVVIFAFFICWIENVKYAYSLQERAKQGKHINSFAEDVKELLNEKFHKTLLFLPVLGIITFTIVPLLVMICVAFTNYDKNHIPPNSLFTWVGWTNFKNIFANSVSITFGYTFRKILVWTLIWAFFATFTTYIGGILLSLLINNERTKCKKLWRTLFIIAIAVPQFVTLLLVRNFFADAGIVNTICKNIGLTDWFHNIGLIKGNIDYIPFLTDKNWAKVMIILINIWIGVPYQMLIATGVLMNIPTELTEAARIDGANKFQIFRKITMPYMLFVTGPSLITSFVANINNFNVIYLLTQDVYITKDQYLANSSGKEIDLLVTWLFRLTQEEYNYKMASVIGILVFIICSIFTLLAFTRVFKGDREEAFN
jgi:arabinogalactan oligomer/maltooligosaccharide transport system permease protein